MVSEISRKIPAFLLIALLWRHYCNVTFVVIIIGNMLNSLIKKNNRLWCQTTLTTMTNYQLISNKDTQGKQSASGFDALISRGWGGGSLELWWRVGQRGIYLYISTLSRNFIYVGDNPPLTDYGFGGLNFSRLRTQGFKF